MFACNASNLSVATPSTSEGVVGAGSNTPGEADPDGAATARGDGARPGTGTAAGAGALPLTSSLQMSK